MGKQSGGRTKRPKSETQKAAQHRRTAKNKMKRIKLAMRTAGDRHKQVLQARLTYWFLRAA